MKNYDMKAIEEEELARHRSRGSCWIAIEGRVFDVTEFLSTHPGGVKLLLQHAWQSSHTLLDF